MADIMRESRKTIKKRMDSAFSTEDAAGKGQEQRKKSKDNAAGRKLEITGPMRVVHKLHVDKDLNWSGKESANSLELMDKLGEGAYGAVYRAVHLTTGHILAVKTVPMGDSEATEDIRKEIDILKQCRHDNIVSLYGCMFNDGVLWIMMDYCGGGSVKDFQKRWPKPLTETEIVAILYFVVKGLCYLHSINIIHRDLKSANILLTEAGDVKIADFGVSFQVNNTLAKGNTVVGTPLFMAPEALLATNTTEKADIWSMAITAIEMVDGVPPHYDENIMRAMLLITTAEPPKPTNAASVSAKFLAFLDRCLKLDADERPSAEELLEDELFAGQDHALVMAGLLAEYRIMRLTSPADGEEEEEEKEKEGAGAVGGSCVAGRQAVADGRQGEQSEEDVRATRPLRRSDSSTSSNGSLGTISHGDLDKVAFINTIVKQKKQWAPDVEESINAMEELMVSLTEQVTQERIMSKEMAKYKSMSYATIVQEIEEMTSTVSQLEAKVESYKKSSRKHRKHNH